MGTKWSHDGSTGVVDDVVVTVVGSIESRDSTLVAGSLATGGTSCHLFLRSSSGRTWKVKAPPEMLADLWPPPDRDPRVEK